MNSNPLAEADPRPSIVTTDVETATLVAASSAATSSSPTMISTTEPTEERLNLTTSGSTLDTATQGVSAASPYQSNPPQQQLPPSPHQPAAPEDRSERGSLCPEEIENPPGDHVNRPLSPERSGGGRRHPFLEQAIRAYASGSTAAKPLVASNTDSGPNLTRALTLDRGATLSASILQQLSHRAVRPLVAGHGTSALSTSHIPRGVASVSLDTVTTPRRGASPSATPRDSKRAKRDPLPTERLTCDVNHSLESDYLCPICLQFIHEAFMTRCGHSFCYQCIATHLEHAHNCPTCRATLKRDQIFPNFQLNRLVGKQLDAFTLPALGPSSVFSRQQLIDQLRALVSDKDQLQLEDLDAVLAALFAKRRDMVSRHRASELDVLLMFLKRARAYKTTILENLQRELACVDKDIQEATQRLRVLVSQTPSTVVPGLRHPMNLVDASSPSGQAPEDTTALISAQPGPGEGVCVPNALSEPEDHEGPTPEILQTSPHHPLQTLSTGDRIPSREEDTRLRSSPERRRIREKRISTHFNDLQQYYFEHRLKVPSKPYHLEEFTQTLATCTRYRSFRPVATLRYGDMMSSSSIVASIEFDRDDEYFATAGVTRKIKVFDYTPIQVHMDTLDQATVSDLMHDTTAGDSWALASLAGGNREGLLTPHRRSIRGVTTDDTALHHHYPVREMVCRSKISCLSWNPYIKTQLANSDYDGMVTLWDAHVGTQVQTFTEHEKRAWSVDFSRTDPTRLASGSDDTKVKIWSTGSNQAVMTLDSKANICCVKFNPSSSHYLSFGSADHYIYYYDLRQPRQALTVFKGHRKAVSYVKFLSSRELVSASTDSTLKLWNLDDAATQSGTTALRGDQGPTGIPPPFQITNRCVRTFGGHVNEKNFVGLSVMGDWVSCGSENNCAYTYYKSLSQPMFSVPFSTQTLIGEEVVVEDPSVFVSSVCWKKDAKVLLAANSQGTVRVLQLV
ncbi:hypothetical protein IWQ61_004344 [Dispira simplex]|nr:hypothetical protein IWQ61_004344 [Dispira simplex]